MNGFDDLIEMLSGKQSGYAVVHGTPAFVQRKRHIGAYAVIDYEINGPFFSFGPIQGGNDENYRT